ncbi:protein STPG3 [Tiliqua scincoides]|uniref:protein STPG3 n=1 Tax=Tiliqua scincoides TaxID=71010 RepID=UPI003461B954
MEFQQKQIKFLAQQYLDGSYAKKPKRTPLLYRRHAQHHWSQASRESSANPLFPGIYSGRQSRRQESPDGRLLLEVNVDSPGPAAYSPSTINYRESSAPSYTFGRKTPPRDGGGRRAWQTAWLQGKHPFTKKVDFARETNWPSPADYSLPLGAQPPNRPNVPNFTIGQKGKFSWVNKDSMNYPGPSQYYTDNAYAQVLNRSPSYIISPAPQTVFVWSSKVGTPGPGAYNVALGHKAALPSSPSFFIQGVRRPKKHETGPFTTL